MKPFVRDHVGLLSAVLAAVSLALVFAAALRAGPVRSLPRAPEWALAAIPHVNAVLSLAAIATIVTGVRAVRRGAIARHRRRMLITAVLFAAFLVLYLYRVALEGPTAFGGPAFLETYAYLPLLAIHVGLAILTVPLVYYVLLLAYAHPVADLPSTNHPRVGRVAAACWLVSFVLGLAVYVMLYWLF